MSYFEDLKVWQRSVDLAVKVYKLSRNDPFNRDFGLPCEIGLLNRLSWFYLNFEIKLTKSIHNIISQGKRSDA